MTKSTEDVVLSIHNKVARLVGEKHEDYTVYICDDGGGPFLSLNTVENEEDYRCLSLSEPSCHDDIDLYRWRFWSTRKNVWLDSTLGWKASDDDVLYFLDECLSEEYIQRAAIYG